MHSHTLAQTPNSLTLSTPTSNVKFAPGATHPTACERADQPRATGQGLPPADEACALTHNGQAIVLVKRTVEFQGAPQPFLYRGQWRGQINLKNGRRLVAMFATSAQCAEWIKDQLAQGPAKFAPPKTPSVTDSDLQRGYARLLATMVTGSSFQVDAATGATAEHALAERAHAESLLSHGQDHARSASSANRSGQPVRHPDSTRFGASPRSVNATSVSQVKHGYSSSE